MVVEAMEDLARSIYSKKIIAGRGNCAKSLSLLSPYTFSTDNDLEQLEIFCRLTIVKSIKTLTNRFSNTRA